MFLLYNFRVMGLQKKFRSVLFTATIGIGIFYLVTWIVRMFGAKMDFMMMEMRPLQNRHQPFH